MEHTEHLNNKCINLIHFVNGILTFSYAVLFSSLALYLTQNIGYSKADANAVVGIFLAFNFALHLLAGYLSDHLISNRALLGISCVLQIIGTYLLTYSLETNLIFGLSFFLLGCGINTTCLKCILTQQFTVHDDRREMAFFINYSVINMGFLLGFFAGGYYDVHANYSQLFTICNVFNLIATVVIALEWKNYKDAEQIFSRSGFFRSTLVFIIFIGLLASLWLGFKYPSMTNLLVVLLGVISFIFLVYQINLTTILREKKNITAFLILTSSSIIFWTLFYVGPMAITHFLKNNVKTDYFNLVIPPQWYMNLNAIFVIIGSPLLALGFQKLKRIGHEINTIQQFSYSIIFIAASFFCLSIGALEANALGYTCAIWIVLHFLLQAIGEICIAPVGFAMIGKLAPKKLQGMMMGFWMMVSGIAASLAQYLSNSANFNETVSPLISNISYINLFNTLGSYSLILGLILLLCAKKINRLMVDKETIPEPSIDLQKA